VAKLIGAEASEIVFTASGTESDNMAVRGVAARTSEPRRRILATPVEHHAVVHTVAALGDEGYPIEFLAVDGDGRLDLDALERTLDERTARVSVMLANNETGVLQPVREAARLAHRAGALLHCDAVQAAGKQAVDVGQLEVDLLTLSAHKIYGPKGVGCLYVRRGTAMAPMLRGGSQERNRRAGTTNVPGVVGFGRAAALARERLEADGPRGPGPGTAGGGRPPLREAQGSPGGAAPRVARCGSKRRRPPRPEHDQRLLRGV